jgi:hypothetical protein
VRISWRQRFELRLSSRSAKVVRKAIAPTGRLILLEAMLRPEATKLYPVLSDLNMLVRTDGCERTEAEYRMLFGRAGFAQNGRDYRSDRNDLDRRQTHVTIWDGWGHNCSRQTRGIHRT